MDSMCDAEPLAASSFLFAEKRRQKPRSRPQKYLHERRTESPGDDDHRVERASVEAKYRAPTRTEPKASAGKVSATKARARSFHWGDHSSSSTNILASFPFHASSFQKDNNEMPDLDNVYDYEIDATSQYKYVPKECASNQRNLSAGSSRQTSPADDTDEAFDRPPSRQRHAFPTHLVDDNELDDEYEYKATKRSHRPPSRHKPMAQDPVVPSSCEINEQSLEDTINRFRSRRSALRQSHDPRRDGFEAVDENVPLPFRIEVTNEDGKGKASSSSRPRRGRPRQAAQAVIAVATTATTDELRKTLQSRAEDPMIFKTTPDRRRQARSSASQGTPWTPKDEAFEPVQHPSAQWIPRSMPDAVPETDEAPAWRLRTENASDLQLDDFNFTGPPDVSLNTSLGKDFLSLFAQS
ncbi:hypothetical protein SDRG_09978 [Saprolegnia diclina VS20]|uniref:Uncharacterized protein n=1 Tax=Saprolegnia diclina (strain VS20) TaxID=1156394 RepID=T0RQ91_SAPDV|nr:hypothetical protein SDRG_09978 [Saprolegnia diclina VS20]EQC32227.1 hypothetical protein SDRG_09978 [Saprolegnia diclina VS20]|eukprot:XP_008614168.1 hypothetical protein SDRG_09978 [Saprolegnia diclina VS20]